MATIRGNRTPTFDFDKYLEEREEGSKTWSATVGENKEETPSSQNPTVQNPAVQAQKPIFDSTTYKTALDAYKNRGQFQYDINADALYQQYKDRYIEQGRQAMMDAAGQASAMTGGYGNSYAQTVGQQTYQQYLNGLNDKVPELYSLALSKYNLDGEQLANIHTMELQSDQQKLNREQFELQKQAAMNKAPTTTSAVDIGRIYDRIYDMEGNPDAIENLINSYLKSGVIDEDVAVELFEYFVYNKNETEVSADGH